MDLADRYIARSLTLLRAAEGEAIESANILDSMYKRIAQHIEDSFKEAKTRTNTKLFQKRVQKEIDEVFGDVLPKELKDLSAAAVTSEIAWNQEAIMGEVAQEIRVPENRRIVSKMNRRAYRGHTFDFWLKKEAGRNAKLAQGLLKEGFISSRPIAEINRDIMSFSRGSKARVRTITRSYFMQSATVARDEVYNINPDIIDGAIWVSVLDNRTTPLLCGVRDGMEYDADRNPVGHSLPWEDGPGALHWNCRSISIPKIIGLDQRANRASTDAGVNYQRGDKTTRTGRVRKNRKDARERGIYKTSERYGTTKYENWLKAQSRTNIDFVSDVLGSKEKARMFRDGRASLLDLRMQSPVARPTNRNSI